MCLNVLYPLNFAINESYFELKTNVPLAPQFLSFLHYRILKFWSKHRNWQHFLKIFWLYKKIVYCSSILFPNKNTCIFNYYYFFMDKNEFKNLLVYQISRLDFNFVLMLIAPLNGTFWKMEFYLAQSRCYI